jgi:hypothetical protein
MKESNSFCEWKANDILEGALDNPIAEIAKNWTQIAICRLDEGEANVAPYACVVNGKQVEEL